MAHATRLLEATEMATGTEARARAMLARIENQQQLTVRAYVRAVDACDTELVIACSQELLRLRGMERRTRGMLERARRRREAAASVVRA